MQWEKKGLIWGAKKNNEWMNNSALQPTPIVLEDRIRVFVGIRDSNGVGRVGYVDVDKECPSKIMKISKTPCLDVGEPGCFDDNGVVPCSIVRVGEDLYLFYAGYNLGHHVRFTVYGGVAISYDNGETFERCSKIPIMDRTENETLFRVIHTAIYENDVWKLYYAAGNKYIKGSKKTLPVYEAKFLEAENFDGFRKEGITIVHTEGKEHRIGRPYVVYEEGIYKMFFCKGSEEEPYKLAYAESLDGENWIRMDDKINLKLSGSGWDNEMMALPAFIRCNGKAYLFYNGNNSGYEGFGYAELIKE